MAIGASPERVDGGGMFDDSGGALFFLVPVGGCRVEPNAECARSLTALFHFL